MSFEATPTSVWTPTTTGGKQNIYTLDGLLLALTRAKINEVVEDDQWSRGTVTLTTTDTLSDAFETLVNNDIQGAPVVTTAGRYCGFVEMIDLVTHVVDLLDTALPSEKFNREFFRQERRFANELVSMVKHRQCRKETHPNMSLYHAFENLAKYGDHRIAMVSRFGQKVTGVITQNTMIKWVADNVNLLGSVKDTPAWMIRPYTTLITMNENRRALDGFKAMRDNNVTGVAVTDYTGRLTDCLSTSDLKGVEPGNERFRNLWNSIASYKRDIKRDYPDHPWTVQCVPRDATLSEILSKLEVWEVHRVFVVDSLSSMNPVDVITMTDVLSFLYEKSTLPDTTR